MGERLQRALALLVAISLAVPWQAAALDRAPTPLEVEVSPSSTVVGGVVTIAGRSVAIGDQQQLAIEILRPDGTHRDLAANLDASQAFSESFSETTVVGNYQVTVFTADRRNQVETSFSVRVAATFRREATEQLTTAFREFEEEANKLTETIREAPASAARDELEDRLDGLLVLMADVDGYLAMLDQGIETLEEAIEQDKPDGKPEPKPKPEDAPDLGPEPDEVDKPDGKPEPKPKPEDAPDLGPEPAEVDKPDGKPEPDAGGPPSPPGGDTEGSGDSGTAADGEVGTGAYTGGEVGTGAYTGDEGDSRARKLDGSGEKPEGEAGGGAYPGEEGEAGGGVYPGGEGDSGAGPGEQRARKLLTDLYEEMGRTADQVQKHQLQFKEQLEKFDYDHTLCDGLHYIQQAWSSMTAAFSLTKKLAETAAGSAMEVTAELSAETALELGAGSVGGSGPETDYARDQLLTNAAHQLAGTLDHFDFLETSVEGLMDYGLERLFRLSCEKYVGPFSGKMTAEVLVDGGRFYAYQTEIKGELRLRYERGSGATQPVTGEFEGVATLFNLEEDLWRVQPEIKKDVLRRWTMPPIPSVFVGDVGFFARAVASPNYFYVPVKGIIDRDKIKFQIEPARIDFEKSSTAVYILVNLSVPFPYVLTQDIPHEGGHYILISALRDEPEFEVTVHRDQAYSDIKRQFQNDASTPDNKVKVRTEVEVRACNPECPD